MASERVSVGRLKARLSEYLRRGRAGDDVVITDRGKPVARLVGLEGDAVLEERAEGW
jgi:prevent-host-death family protein